MTLKLQLLVAEWELQVCTVSRQAGVGKQDCSRLSPVEMSTWVRADG
jgi:hypothetical protein